MSHDPRLREVRCAGCPAVVAQWIWSAERARLWPRLQLGSVSGLRRVRWASDAALPDGWAALGDGRAACSLACAILAGDAATAAGGG